MIFRSQSVVTPDGVRPADVVVENGTIVEVREPRGECDVDAGSSALLPGAVDVHVHINEPGRTHWEGFASATRAAVAGGTTSLVDMPLNSRPVTTDPSAFDAKVEASAGQLSCDVGLWGGVVPGNADQLRRLWNRGVLGYKAFLIDSGIDEFGWVDESDLREAFEVLAQLPGAVLLAHCEAPGPIRAAAPAAARYDPTSYEGWLVGRPPEAEVKAIANLVALSEEFGVRVHVVHLATEEAFDLLRAARAKGVLVTVETCAHYLTFCAEEIPDGGVAWKCAPPIRTAATREALWRALEAGLLDFVTTDHSPSPPDVKHLDTGDFRSAWGGIASVQLLTRAVWTGCVTRGLGLERLTQWVSTAPAAFAGLEHKGAIRVGADADFVIFDPGASAVVTPEELFHRHAVCPYIGLELSGRIEATYLRGRLAWDASGHTTPAGELLLREQD